MTRLDPLEVQTSRSDQVYVRLREAIASLEWRPGQPIVEAEVARQLGVSTTPVREALQRLSQQGLVVTHRYRGATVAEISMEDVRDIFELRNLMEPFAARLAVPDLTAEDFARMETAIREATATIVRRDWRTLSQWNRTFHGVFIQRCHNRRLQRVLENLQEQNRMVALLTWEERGYDDRQHEEHRAILAAALARDADAAADLVRQHIERFNDEVVDVWSRRAAHYTPLRLGHLEGPGLIDGPRPLDDAGQEAPQTVGPIPQDSRGEEER